MSIKGKLFGLAAAVGLGVSFINPASAAPINVTVTVQDGGGTIAFDIQAGDNADFSNVTVNAAESSTLGVNTTLPAKVFTIVMTGDTALNRPGGAVNIKLGDGAAANAYLA